MGGGLLQLVAYGAQDAYITGNPHITFWKVLYKRHTNFAIEAMRVNFTGAPAYGQRLVAVVNRNADLVWKTYVEVTLPDTTLMTSAGRWSVGTSRRIGYALLKKIEVEIGGQIIDTHYGEWLYLWENLTADYDTAVKLDSLMGGDVPGTSTSMNSCRGRPQVLYIPLQFWFNRNPGLALPLIALQYHEVRFNIYLGAATDLIQGTPGAGVGTAGSIGSQAAALPPPKEMCLYLDYIYLDVDERRRFAQESHEYLIDQVQRGIPQTINTASARIDLTLNHPVKELVWVFQDARKLECGSDSSVALGYTRPFSYDDIVNRCRLQLNGQDRFDERYGDYFYKVQPYQHHSGGAFWPTINASTQNAGVNLAGNVIIAAASITGNVLTVTNVTSGLITEGMLIVGETANQVPANTFIVDYGTGNGGTGTYEISTTVGASTTVALTAVTSVAARGFPPNVSQDPFGTINPINVYSFAISPEEHQPSGTCNFSRIDNTTLVFDSIQSTGAGTFPSKNYPFFFKSYAVNYNIFRIMSGMGGLAYSN
jgi:hypothetical protein